MNDHELCNYIKENFLPLPGEAMVILISYDPELQLEEKLFESEEKLNHFLMGRPADDMYALIKYRDNEKHFYFEGRDYIGDENMTTGEIYDWFIREKGPLEKPTRKQLQDELKKLIKFISK